MNSDKIFYRKRAQQGISMLLLILLFSLIGTIVLITIQSRLLLAIQRNKSASDVLISTYLAESKTNDAIAQLYGHYREDLLLNSTDTIDETEIKTKGEQQPDGSVKLSITATRPYAVSQIEAIKRDITQTDYDRVEIVLGLDCTSSMNRPADPAYPLGPTSFEAEEAAAINFIEGIKDIDSPLVSFHVGILVFGVDARWLQFGSVDIKPDTAISISDIQTAIANGIERTKAESPACADIIDATSIGSAYAKAHEYYTSKDMTRIKGIEVVVTDGAPNSRPPLLSCPNDGFTSTTFCPGFPKDSITQHNYCDDRPYDWDCYKGDTYQDGPFGNVDSYYFNETAYDTCMPLGKDFLKCTLADTSKAYSTSDGHIYQGIRNPDIDAYALTIYALPPAEIVSIFNDFLTVNGYYNATQAADLPAKLNEILTNIINSFSTITIRRVVP